MKQAPDKGWGDPVSFTKLTDDSPMPFGKHAGVPMASVPASYFDWLRDQDWIIDRPAIKDYIDRNWKEIEMELHEDEGQNASWPPDDEEIPW